MPDSNDNIPSSSRRKSLIDMPGLWRPILFVLIPLFLEQVSILVYYASDQYLLGHFFETPHIAAYGTMGYLMGLFFGIGSLASIGSAVMVARFAGAKDDSQLNKVLNQSLTLAIFFGIVLFVYWSVNAENTFRMLGLKDDTLVFAVQYMRIFRWSFPFFILYYVGLANFHGSGNMIVGLCITCAKNFITIVISWGCVTGFGIFPTLGWWGMNFAITCGYCFDGIAILIILRHGIYGRRLIFREMIPQWSMIRRILAIGIPGGLTILVTIFAEIWFITQINGLGQLSAAAHEICFRIQTLAYNPVYAFSLVAMTLVGQYLGAGLLPRTKRTILVVYCVTIVYLLSIGIIFYFFPDRVATIFLKPSSQAGLGTLAASLLKISAFILPAYAGTLVLNGALQGAGDTRITFVIALASFFCVRVPLVYLLAFQEFEIQWLNVHLTGYGLGIAGAWIALLLDYWTRNLLFTLRFLSGRWHKIRV